MIQRDANEQNRMMMDFSYHAPTELNFGNGVFSKTPKAAAGLGKHALLVTSRKSMHELGCVDELIAGLRHVGIESTCFRDFSLGPTTNEVDEGAELANEVGADMVIALGGGSVLDGGKAIAAVACSNASAAEMLRGQAAVHTALPVIAVPTTSGTGSEMNKSSIITDSERQYKDGIRSPKLFPRVALVDPQLTLSVPVRVTAHTGFDVLAHAIESFVSPRAQPITDQLALAAIRTVSQWLPIVLNDLTNLEGRTHLAYASATMGINLATVGTCLPHRIDKALCALHPEISHGQSVAIFYQAWGEMACLGSVDRFAQIVEIISPNTNGGSRTKAQQFAEKIGSFLESIEMKKTLTDFNVSSAEIPNIVERVAGDLSINPVPVEKSDLPELLTRVFDA